MNLYKVALELSLPMDMWCPSCGGAKEALIAGARAQTRRCGLFPRTGAVSPGELEYLDTVAVGPSGIQFLAGTRFVVEVRAASQEQAVQKARAMAMDTEVSAPGMLKVCGKWGSREEDGYRWEELG